MLHTTEAVVEEIYTLTRRRLGFDAAMATVDAIQRGGVFEVHEDDSAMAWAIVRELRSIPLSYQDASLIALSRQLGVREIFTFDSDFALAGLIVLP